MGRRPIVILGHTAGLGGLAVCLVRAVRRTRRRPVVQCGVFFLAALFAATASAQVRYPWDTGKETCSTTPASATAFCLQANWPNFSETRQRLTQLVLSRQFGLLDGALNDISRTQMESRTGTPLSESAVSAIFEFMAEGAPGMTPSQIASMWRAAVPDSRFIPIVEALTLRERAWKVRGTRIGALVSPESEQLFATHLASAERLLLDAPDDLKQLPLWHHVLLVIAMDSRKLSTDGPTEFQAAVKRWPRYFPFYNLVLARMTPTQGGNWVLVESFVSDWTRQLGATEGTSMYARLYDSLMGYGGGPVPTQLDWKRMKASFADLIARYPDPQFKEALVAHACRAADRPAFRKAVAEIAQEQLRHIGWLQGYSYEACMSWNSRR